LQATGNRTSVLSCVLCQLQRKRSCLSWGLSKETLPLEKARLEFCVRMSEHGAEHGSQGAAAPETQRSISGRLLGLRFMQRALERTQPEHRDHLRTTGTLPHQTSGKARHSVEKKAQQPANEERRLLVVCDYEYSVAAEDLKLSQYATARQRYGFETTAVFFEEEATTGLVLARTESSPNNVDETLRQAPGSTPRHPDTRHGDERFRELAHDGRARRRLDGSRVAKRSAPSSLAEASFCSVRGHQRKPCRFSKLTRSSQQGATTRRR
jgi:hypothetical protein